jgi:uncharacterized protein YciI
MSEQPGPLDMSRFLGKDIYVIVTRPVRPEPIPRDKMQEHRTRQVELEKQGIMFAAGPLFAAGAELPEAGMLVIRASSFHEADASAAADPLHKAGLRNTRCSAGA